MEIFLNFIQVFLFLILFIKTLQNYLKLLLIQTIYSSKKSIEIIKK